MTVHAIVKMSGKTADDQEPTTGENDLLKSEDYVSRFNIKYMYLCIQHKSCLIA